MTDVVKVALIAGVCGSIPSVGAFLLGIINRGKIGMVQEKLDGRLTELLDLTRKSSHAEGMKDEGEKRDSV